MAEGKCKKTSSKYRSDERKQQRRKAQRILNHLARVYGSDDVAQGALESLNSMYIKGVVATKQKMSAVKPPLWMKRSEWNKTLRNIMERFAVGKVKAAKLYHSGVSVA